VLKDKGNPIVKAAGLLKSGSYGSVLCFILPKRMQFYSSPSLIHTPTILLSSRPNRIPRNYTTRRRPRSQTRNFTGNSEINRTNLERWRNHAPDATKVPGIGTRRVSGDNNGRGRGRPACAADIYSPVGISVKQRTNCAPRKRGG
jgi:hypothetical protein